MMEKYTDPLGEGLDEDKRVRIKGMFRQAAQPFHIKMKITPPPGSYGYIQDITTELSDIPSLKKKILHAEGEKIKNLNIEQLNIFYLKNDKWFELSDISSIQDDDIHSLLLLPLHMTPEMNEPKLEMEHIESPMKGSKKKKKKKKKKSTKNKSKKYKRRSIRKL